VRSNSGNREIFAANPSKGGTHRSRSLLNIRTQTSACTMEDNMRLLVLGLATLALSAGVASAQPANPVYPRYGYAPFGYGYYGYRHPYYHHRYYAYHGYRRAYRY